MSDIVNRQDSVRNILSFESLEKTNYKKNFKYCVVLGLIKYIYEGKIANK